MNFNFQANETWDVGGKIYIDDSSVGYIQKYADEQWIAIADDVPTGFGQLFPTSADAVFAIIEGTITETELDENFAKVDKFVSQFHTAKEQQQLAQIDAGYEAAKYGEYA